MDDLAQPAEAPSSALVGGRISDPLMAELVAQLAVGESGDRGLPWLGARTPSTAARAAAAAAGVGVVLLAVLVVPWAAGLLL